MQNLESGDGIYIPSSSTRTSGSQEEGVTPIVVDASESVAAHELVLLKTKDVGSPNGGIQPWLPPELWRHVFTCAVGRPKIAWSHFFRSSETTPQCSWANAIVLVCRSWHAMAIDLLYDNIALTSLPRACLFHLTLSSSPRKYGQLVRRISISCMIQHTDKDSTFFKCMTGIVMNCPSLQGITLGRNHFRPTHNWEDVISDIASKITELHLDEHNHQWRRWRLTLPSRDLMALSIFSNLRSLTVPWPATGTYSQNITIPCLRDLTLCIVSNVCLTHPPLSLPSLRNLTFNLQYKNILTVGVRSDWTVLEDDLHRIFSKVLTAYGPLLRRLHLNPVDWNRGWGDLVINNQLLLDYCPSLEHFITYAAGASKASYHPVLRWIDMWVPTEQMNDPSSDYTHDPTAACVQNAAGFPALQGCRFLDLALSPITELPVLLFPAGFLPRDGSSVPWTMPPFRISQTRERVIWADPYEYHSDSDSSYAPSSIDGEESAEFTDDDSSSDDFGPEPSESSDAEPRFDIHGLAEAAVALGIDQ